MLDIPVDVVNNQVVLSTGPGLNPAAAGSGQATPSKTGSQTDTGNPITSTPRLTLRRLVSPVGRNGRPDPKGKYERAGASTIYREQGNRLIAVKFSVRGRDLAGAVDEAREKTKEIVKAPYRIVWSGEFEEMEKAEKRLMLVIPLSLGLIFILLYLAFHSLLDAVVVLSNVFDLAVGGIWALLLTGTHFSISAAVGFVSLFGVAIMDGLLMISYFNSLRSHGLPLREAIMEGAGKRVRPVMMTALTAILGLLPAACLDTDRRPDAAAAGHCGGRRHVDDAVIDALPDAGAVQFLRPPRATGRFRRPGSLNERPGSQHCPPPRTSRPGKCRPLGRPPLQKARSPRRPNVHFGLHGAAMGTSSCFHNFLTGAGLRRADSAPDTCRGVAVNSSVWRVLSLTVLLGEYACNNPSLVEEATTDATDCDPGCGRCPPGEARERPQGFETLALDFARASWLR